MTLHSPKGSMGVVVALKSKTAGSSAWPYLVILYLTYLKAKKNLSSRHSTTQPH